MCLVIFAWKVHPVQRLILAANRDEFYGRRSQELHWWPDRQDILAGRDLQAGGTWLATARSGRFATVTNYREQQEPAHGLRSRGEIVTDFVSSDHPAQEFNAALSSDRYAGFSLLTAERDTLCYVSNRGDESVQLEPGIYGLSNASLDTPWPKLLRTREALAQLIEEDDVHEASLLHLMSDRKTADTTDDDTLPFELARALTAPFIQTAEYGTRCTSVLFWDYDEKISLTERRFDSTGNASGDSNFTYVANQDSRPNHATDPA